MRDDRELDSISGRVISVIYQNEENGYAVLRIQAEESVFAAVGCIPYPAPGEELSLYGEWVSHPSYGAQFKIHAVERRMPASVSEIAEYLSSGVIKGLGPVTAKRIVDVYGEDSLDIIENTPERLMQVKGFTQKKAMSVSRSFKAQLGMRRLMEFLKSNGLPPQTASKLYKDYGDAAMAALRANPYMLVGDYYGVKFEEADAMAGNCGIPANDPRRAEAGVKYVLSHNLQNGHAFIPHGKLVAAAAKVLDIAGEDIERAADSLMESGETVYETIAGEEAVYLRALYEAERYAAKRLEAMSGSCSPAAETIDEMIRNIEKELAIEYAPAQREAVCTAAVSQAMLLTGGPGTGKTTSVRGIIALFDLMGLTTVLAAPTGRAAKRMSELCGKEASTIHRLLEMGFDPGSGEFMFAKNEKNRIKAEAVIVDETSMVDILLFDALLKAMSEECRLVMIGDPDQLPSVGPGNLLSDILRSKRIRTVHLTEIFRQAEASAIIMNAHAVNRGEHPDLTRRDADFFFLKRVSPESVVETVLELYGERLPGKLGLARTQIQVLSPTRLYATGTVNLNRCLQAAINPPSPDKPEKYFGEYIFRTGDRVMQIRNNYDIMWKRRDNQSGIGMFNGDVGRIVSIDIKDGTMLIDFDGRFAAYDFDMLGELELAYAMTVHKSQGSEYDAVILALLDGAPFLFSRSILYTAITRAKGMLIIVGDERRIAEMVKNNRQHKRYSGLRARLADSGAKL